MTLLDEALAPVLRDLASSGSVLPQIVPVWPPDVPGQGQDTVMLFGVGGSGQGISVVAGRTFPENVSSVADQLQDWAVEELAARGRPATWPECPEHPASHPLSPRVRAGLAVWVCPGSGLLVCDIGDLSAGA